MEEKLNKEAKQGWRSPNDAARITDEGASSEDRKHTSRAVFVATEKKGVEVVDDKEECAVVFILRMGEGSPAQSWVNVKGGLRVIALRIWHPEGWTPKNDATMEAVVKQARTTSHPWLVTCDANNGHQ